MEIGDYRLEVVRDTEFWLDGGAMFGIVPRALWEHVAPPDEKNRIRLTTNCVFIDTGREKILIDTGIGEKWNAKEIEIYGINRKRPFAESLESITGSTPDDISIVINTHLHFDHAGGNTMDIEQTTVAAVAQKPARSKGESIQCAEETPHSALRPHSSDPFCPSVLTTLSNSAKRNSSLAIRTSLAFTASSSFWFSP